MCIPEVRRSVVETQTIEGESPVVESGRELVVSRVPSDTSNPVGSRGAHPPKPKYYLMTDSGKYCEGTVKRTPGGE